MTQVADAQSIFELVESDAATLRLPTRLEWVGKAAEYLRSRAEACGVCDRARGDQLVVALHEALTNAIVHGNLGISSALKEEAGDAFARAVAERSADPALAERQVTVAFCYDGDACRIRVRDEGDGFDWRARLAVADADADPDAAPSLLCSGRGILIMRAFTDGLEYRDGGRELELTLRGTRRENRRDGERRPWGQPMRVVPLDADGKPDRARAWDALTRDVSASGIAMIQSKAHTATRVLVELRDGDRTEYVPADVCRVTPLDGGMIQIGCRFETVARDDVETSGASRAVVEQLLDGIERQAEQHHRRAYPRVSYSATIQVRSAGEGPYRTAFSRDLSRGGMAFVAAFELPKGPIDLLLPGHCESAPIRARATRCQRITAGVFDVGCAFI